MTVSPVVSDDGSQERIVDFEVSTGPRLRNGMAPDADTYYQEDEQGRFVFQDDGFQEEHDDGIRFDEEDYIATLLESDPNIQASIEWASTALPPEMIEKFNNAINTGDIDSINKELEWLINLYLTENAEAFEDGDEEIEEISDAEFADAVEGLMEMEPAGTETAFAFLEAAQQTEDPAFKDAYRLTAQYHRGEIGSEDAIQSMIERHGLNAAAAVFRELGN